MKLDLLKKSKAFKLLSEIYDCLFKIENDLECVDRSLNKRYYTQEDKEKLRQKVKHHEFTKRSSS